MLAPSKQRQNSVQAPKQASTVLRFIVVGTKRSGKSRFIESISQYTEWQDQSHQGWFFGRVRVDQSLILHLMEPPEEAMSDFMWLRDMVSRIRATGFVVMIDSSKPQLFAPFVSILYTIRGYHPDTPLVVAANKQDHPHAWGVEDIQLGLGLRDMVVMPCVATNRDTVRDVLIGLMSQWEEKAAR